MKFINYKKFGKCFYYTNTKVHLMVTIDFGPRIIFFGDDLKHNLMFEDVNDTFNMKTKPFKKIFGQNACWHAYGGHRLWVTPETLYTYEPDNSAVKIKKINNCTFAFIAPIQKINKLQFIMKIQIVGASLMIDHIIINHSNKTKLLAPWAITSLTSHGVATFKMNDNNTGFLPNRKLILWPYTKLTDKRLVLKNNNIFLKMNPKIKHPIKIGLDCLCGEASYLVNKTRLTIESKYQLNGNYPDGGSSIESYANERFLEIETLGPITNLKPQAKLVHQEKWTLSKER